MATHRRGRPGSLSRSRASVFGGMGTSSSRTLPRKHRRRNRAHCATRELVGVSSLSVRNIRLIYGSLVRVTSSNAEVGICAPRPSWRRVAAPFVPGDVLRCHRRARRHPSIGHATDRDFYGPNGSRKPPSICTPARGPDGMPGTTTNRVPTRSPRPRSDTGSSRSFEVSAVPSRSLATPRPFFQDPAAPRGPSRPCAPVRRLALRFADDFLALRRSGALDRDRLTFGRNRIRRNCRNSRTLRPSPPPQPRR